MPDPTMQRLRAVAAAAPDFLPPDLAGWLAAGVARYEAAAGTLGLDAALGLGAPGARGWWTREAIEARDAALVAIRAQHFPALSDRQAARQIASLARRRSPLTEPATRHAPLPSDRQLRAILGQ